MFLQRYWYSLLKLFKNFFMGCGVEGKQEIKIFCVIPFVLYFYKAKVYDQVTIYKGKRNETDHTGYAYGVSITPMFQIQITHGSNKKK